MDSATLSPSSPTPDDLAGSTQRYLGALTVLDDESLRAPSVLPGWSRAHVVAHLSRNADAFTRVLEQAATGGPASMYDSGEDRDREIGATVTGLDLAGLLEDARSSAERLQQALSTLVVASTARFTRLAGQDGEADGFPAETLVARRRAEVEIHHSDLDLDYPAAGWPPDFSRAVVGQRQDELAALPGGGPSMVLSSTDEPGLWKLGAGPGPEVHGRVGDLAWWLVGRGGGAGLTSSPGPLPVLGRWR